MKEIVLYLFYNIAIYGIEKAKPSVRRGRKATGLYHGVSRVTNSVQYTFLYYLHYSLFLHVTLYSGVDIYMKEFVMFFVYFYLLVALFLAIYTIVDRERLRYYRVFNLMKYEEEEALSHIL